MHLRYLGCLAVLVPILVAGCATTPAATSSSGPARGAVSPAPAPAALAAAPASEGPEQNLKEGMGGDDVRRIMGDPAEVKPMPNQSGKAEIWIYRRTIAQRVEQVVVGTKPITYSTVGSDGNAHSETVAEEPIYKQAVKTDIDVLQLLIFEGHYLSQKHTTEKQLSYR
jgi:hypothetical protein